MSDFLKTLGMSLLMPFFVVLSAVATSLPLGLLLAVVMYFVGDNGFEFVRWFLNITTISALWYSFQFSAIGREHEKYSCFFYSMSILACWVLITHFYGNNLPIIKEFL